MDVSQHFNDIHHVAAMTCKKCARCLGSAAIVSLAGLRLKIGRSSIHATKLLGDDDAFLNEPTVISN